MIGFLWRRWLTRYDRMRREGDAALGIYRTLDEARAVNGFAVITSSMGRRVLVVARAREVAGGEGALGTVADWLFEVDWGIRPSGESYAQDDDPYVVGYQRDDPVGMADDDWLWLHDEPEQLGWRKQFTEALWGSTKPLHPPQIDVAPEVLTALLDDYDSRRGWLHGLFGDSTPGLPAVERIGGDPWTSWDPWFERGVQVLGPPQVGRVWYLSTVKTLLEEHRPGAFDRLIAGK